MVPFAFDPFLDFLVWILEVDGLLVHPFDKHIQGNRILQERGLTSESWSLWLTRLIAQKKLASTRAGLSDKLLDKVKEESKRASLNPILETLFRKFVGGGRSYQEYMVQGFEIIKLESDSAVEKLWDCIQSIFEDINSPEECISISICQMCPGGSAIRNKLEEFWSEYQKNVYTNRFNVFERSTSHLIFPRMHHYLSSRKRCEFKRLVELEKFLEQNNGFDIALYLVFYTPGVQNMQINLDCIRPTFLVPVDDSRMPGSNIAFPKPVRYI